MKQLISNFVTAAAFCTAVIGASFAAYADEPIEQVATPGGETLKYAGASSNTARFASAEMTCDTEGAEIHYELYDKETVNGNYPEVTLDSPKFDPENPQIWLNCTPGRTYGIRARAFKDGMLPSALKSGAFQFIYNECGTLKELMTLPTGVANQNFPLCCTATVTVTYYLDYLKSTSYYKMDRNFLYVQDDETAIAIQYYDGSLGLQPGDQITDLCVQRYTDSKGNVTFAFSGGNASTSSNKIRIAPRVVGHVDLHPREITPEEFKDQPEYYLLKISGVDNVNYYSSNHYFEMQWKGEWVDRSLLVGRHNDPSLREHLEENSVYDIVGLKYRTGTLDFLWADKHMAMPRVFPALAEGQTEVVVPSNQPIYISSRDAASKIYYTLDGSAPDEKSTLYTGPFAVPVLPKVTVRYAAYGEGGLPSEGKAVTYERNELQTVGFDFADPASLLPVLADPEDSYYYEKEPLAYTATRDGVTVKLTMTPAEGKYFCVERDEDGLVSIELPVGTEIKVESSHAIKGLSYRYGSESEGLDALKPTDEDVSGESTSAGWTIAGNSADRYILNFTSGYVGFYDKPKFESLFVNVDPQKADPGQSGIGSVKSDGEVLVCGRTLTISGYADVVFTVYDMLGHSHESISADGGSISRTLDLPSGVYLLGRSDNSDAMKFVIR